MWWFESWRDFFSLGKQTMHRAHWRKQHYLKSNSESTMVLNFKEESTPHLLSSSSIIHPGSRSWLQCPFKQTTQKKTQLSKETNALMLTYSQPN